MHRSSKHPSFLRLWWRRKSFYLRHLPHRQLVCIALVVLTLIFLTPNPFSSQYEKIPLRQDIQWDSIADIVQLKEKILADDLLSKQVKRRGRGQSVNSISSKPIIILLYTNIFLSKRYCHTKAESIFGQSCPSKNRCQWTCNRRQLGEADAIIFHGYDMQYYPSGMPQRSETKPGAIWILWSDEPHTIVDYYLFKDYKFNWTISFKMNSEVSIGSYGLFIKRSVPLSNSEYSLWVDEQFHHRANAALWFVSNCDARERLDLFHALGREANTSVEGYGRCVERYPMHYCTAGTRCEHDYMSKFKYYLSFESITCRDYITEKFFKAFYHGLIPIVHGPDRKDYEQFAPADSFIHVNDFHKNTNQLANYLLEVHLNFTLFSKYHQWRKTHDVIIDGKALDRIRMCELCERLSHVQQDEVTYYEDVGQFYREKC